MLNTMRKSKLTAGAAALTLILALGTSGNAFAGAVNDSANSHDSGLSAWLQSLYGSSMPIDMAHAIRLWLTGNVLP